eukprot:CAMPEP_0184484852 /NCGR_PEP_ID=MMETSP0113_2-20130426/6530_1 /TAXON_ID=91329 /ORGANISM="Norrisiella sphaerica, Strain BC52" /LENGTH=278 /DNA_ID=CAMNT_0026866033 /DNA_START=48 /DNA_END=884 /DNA_ORIENTATION=-
MTASIYSTLNSTRWLRTPNEHYLLQLFRREVGYSQEQAFKAWDIRTRLSLYTVSHKKILGEDHGFGFELPDLPALTPWHFQRCIIPYKSWFDLHTSPPLKALMEEASAENRTYLVLGSGFGCAALYASAVFGIETLGYEPNCEYFETIERLQSLQLPGIHFECRDADPLESDVSESSIIFVGTFFGPVDVVARASVYAKLLTKTKVGTCIIDTERGLEKGDFAKYFRCIQRCTLPMPYDAEQSFFVYQRIKRWDGQEEATIGQILLEKALMQLKEDIM